jgi:hypothetical protein
MDFKFLTVVAKKSSLSWDIKPWHYILKELFLASLDLIPNYFNNITYILVT